LTDQRRSPNTVKAYAHDLKDYLEYLTGRGLAWDRLRYDELAAFSRGSGYLPQRGEIGAAGNQLSVQRIDHQPQTVRGHVVLRIPPTSRRGDGLDDPPIRRPDRFRTVVFECFMESTLRGADA
jgi:hypothetical protein